MKPGRIAERWRAEAALAAELDRHYGPGRAQVTETLGLGPGRAVHAGRLDGAAVVFKRIFGPAPGATLAGMRSELDRCAPHFPASGGLRLVRCIDILPQAGLAVLEHAPGVRVDRLLNGLGGARRGALIARCADWLGCYTAPTRATGAFGGGYWRDRVALMTAPAGMDAADAALLADLRAALTRRAMALTGQKLCRAATHGDFAPINLTCDTGSDGAVWGFDVQGQSVMPLARDVARFLVMLAVHGTVPPEALPGVLAGASPDMPRALGLNRDDLAAFLSRDLLEPEEAATVLPFFVGERLGHALIADHHRRDCRDAARAAIGSWLTLPEAARHA